jgi:ABC-2 type transport system ATP-binding protein
VRDHHGALVAEPPVLFLDEPTTGLDPRSRIELWGVIRELVARGTTLLLTTQYLEEADQLADEILVIDHGRELARGTSEQLKARVGGDRIEVTLEDRAQLEVARVALSALAVGEVEVDGDSATLLAPVSGGAADLTTALRELDDRAVAVRDVGLRRPTLDDVFLTLTGQPKPTSEDT